MLYCYNADYARQSLFWSEASTVRLVQLPVITKKTLPFDWKHEVYFFKPNFIGVWGIGLGSEKADLNVIPMGNDADSWVLCSDGYLRHNKEEMHRITQLPQEGDTIVSLN